MFCYICSASYFGNYSRHSAQASSIIWYGKLKSLKPTEQVNRKRCRSLQSAPLTCICVSAGSCTFSFSCTFLCCNILYLRMNLRSQWSHWCGFSPLWILRWRQSPEASASSLPQISHLNVGLPVGPTCGCPAAEVQQEEEGLSNFALAVWGGQGGAIRLKITCSR